MGALDGEVAAFLEQKPGADGVGRKLSQLLLGFLATEVVPLANRLAELGIDPTPLFAATSGILRLYADALEHPRASPLTPMAYSPRPSSCRRCTAWLREETPSLR
jgi:hypothetical protein